MLEQIGKSQFEKATNEFSFLLSFFQSQKKNTNLFQTTVVGAEESDGVSADFRRRHRDGGDGRVGVTQDGFGADRRHSGNFQADQAEVQNVPSGLKKKSEQNIQITIIAIQQHN